jgi:hypothetical protein
MNHSTILKSMALVLGGLSFAIFVPTGQPLVAALPPDTCTADCFYCGWGRKAIISMGSPSSYWNYPYSCTDVECPCPCLPNPCGPGGDDAASPGGTPTLEVVLARIIAADLAGDAESIAEIVASDERYELNDARGALQIIGCNDNVAVSLRLRRSVLTAVHQALASAPAG